MRHPLHDILSRWLDSEQFAYDATAREHWLPEPWPQQAEDARQRSGQPGPSHETAPRNPG